MTRFNFCLSFFKGRRLDRREGKEEEGAEDEKFQHQQNQSEVIQSCETGPLLTESKVIERDMERDELLKWLMKPQSEEDQDNKRNVSLRSIVGCGGIGKTALAQLVYNDEEVQKFFDLKMWVCASTLEGYQFTASVLESATKSRPEYDSIVFLQIQLQKKLMSSNKFLLVLDDVQDHVVYFDWEKLLAPLIYGHKGSKILLTTRTRRVAIEAALAVRGPIEESIVHLE